MSLLILVVDDESDVEMLFRQQLGATSAPTRFTMDFAQSAGSAFQRISDAAGASLILILSDIRMPGMGGFDFLPKAKPLDRTSPSLRSPPTAMTIPRRKPWKAAPRGS